jgi:serine/threonine protein kinase
MTLANKPELAGYRLIECIGRGVLGEVYRAKREDGGAACAVKILDPELTSEPGFEHRFQETVWRCKSFDHPHLVRLFEAVHIPGRITYLVTEYVAGLHGPAQSLERLLAKRGNRPLAERKVRALALQILEALHYVHDRGVLHLGLKPSSILVDAGGRVRLTHVGLAGAVGEARLAERLLTVRRFEPGVFPTWEDVRAPEASERSRRAASRSEAPVTPDAPGGPRDPESGAAAPGGGAVVNPRLTEAADYLAPEQKADRISDVRTDLYAVGAVIYRLLTGRRPGRMMARPTDVVKGLSPAWNQVLEQCLDEVPGQRYGSAAEARDELQALQPAQPLWNRRKVVRLVVLGPAVALLVWFLASVVWPGIGGWGFLDWTLHRSVRLPGGVRLRFVSIPAGDFRMGESSPAGSLFEEPAHVVRLTRAFDLSATEVTQAQWQAVMGDKPSQFSGDPTRPVERVSWYDCQQFVKRLNELELGTFRMPTEAEWEYAYRAGTRTRCYWGDEVEPGADDHAWHGGNAGCVSHPVATRQSNTWGLFDMAGNVAEWCVDRYGPYPPRPVTDPRGPLNGRARVVRGGSFLPAKSDLRAAARDKADPDVRVAFIGFRVVREVEE